MKKKIILIAGLGNPGKEYSNTRHNVGFNCIDYIIKNLNLGKSKNKFNTEIWEYIPNNSLKFIFAKPLSYMNLSGTPLVSISAFYDIDINNMYIIYDDKDLNFLKIKIKFNGSFAGHNGLKDIIQKFNTSNIRRIKIGIGYNQNYSIKDWVLSNFSIKEKEQLHQVYKNILNIINDLINGYTIEKIVSLNIYNNK